ncbi:hypothetical protein [Actinoplanes sp. URMC 104]|uniref:hypothetical protein n=1 Tax=Actinoplanes sp. URMC 104 TaxID=3423409 RepID=UPI003F1954DC
MAVTDHLFALADQDPIAVETADWSTGLVVPMASGALIYTGIDRGTVTVSVEQHNSAPAVADVRQWNHIIWDDITEASVHAPQGQLRVCPLEGDLPDLPLLSTAGPGWYRVRVHARGRDNHFDAVTEESGEQYTVQVWPQPPQPHLIVRASDHCGYGLRLSALDAPQPAPGRQPPPQPIQDRDAQMRAALLAHQPDHDI